jgi:uncharacterized protein
MMNERAISIDCAGDSMVGIVHAPDAYTDLGVVVVVGGPQYRVGSHRQFVQLARALAVAGHAVMRFDVRGMGDSDGAPRGFEDIDADIGAAIDALLAHAPAVRRVALWGLCDGASAALLYMRSTCDVRVAGICAVNPWVRSEVGLARAQVKHYYLGRVLTGEFWLKLLRGGVGLAAMRELSGKLALVLRSAGTSATHGRDAFTERMALACEKLPPGGLLMILSENDYTAKEFAEHIARSPHWQRALRITAARRCEMRGADHTFSAPDAHAEVATVTIRWLADLSSLSRRSMSPFAEVA